MASCSYPSAAAASGTAVVLAGQLRSLLDRVVQENLDQQVLRQLHSEERAKAEIFVHASLEYSPPFTMCLRGSASMDAGVRRCRRALEREGYANSSTDAASGSAALDRADRLRRFLEAHAILRAWALAPDDELPHARVVSSGTPALVRPSALRRAHQRELCAVGFQNKVAGRLLARWAWLADRLDEAEVVRERPYAWVLQARPDLRWECPVLASLRLAGAVVMQEDWLWLAERAAAGQLLRLARHTPCAKSCNHHAACVDHVAALVCGKTVLEPSPLLYSRNLTLRAAGFRMRQQSIAAPWRHQVRLARANTSTRSALYLRPAHAPVCAQPCVAPPAVAVGEPAGDGLFASCFLRTG